ncbi:hypothetical protein [Pelagicoccus mobilis]|uniref:Right handed beta helix domain-containing protein n=1 Tax=Pelagicoccus mobilis TaxID=415221 RepID=A0A934VSB5_9BACT|nr:hypothetical protein [Pelagicoccus mobilis]MBK1878498.1 hypothetical protein [Pelagicoccus mobilis]
MLSLRIPLIASCLTALAATQTFTHAAVELDANGWTVITPSHDSRIVYVSSSEGDNANDGLSPSTPKKTIASGDSLIRDGYPDHLLLKRGDTFTPTAATALGRWKNGRGPDEPIVCSYYGDEGPRPIIKIKDRFINHDGHPRHFQAFIGLDIYKSNSDPDSPDFDNSSCVETLRFIGSGAYIRLEDCRVRFGMVTIQSYAGVYAYPEVRRNIITDAWANGSYYSHSAEGRIQGIYISGVDSGYLLEENFIDHCGWSATVMGAGANKYNHNVYIQYDNVEGGIIRGNIISRGAAHGIQARSGGHIDRNLFILNAVSLNVGGHKVATKPAVLSYDNRAKENVVLTGRLMDPNNSQEPRSAAVWGIDANVLLPGTDVHDNIIANRQDDGVNTAFLGNGNLSNNVTYNWDKDTDTFDPSWPHPGHHAGHYFASIGGGSNRTLDYLEWLRERPLRSLPWEMTAYSAINYIREGFNKAPVDGYFEYGEAVEPVDPEKPEITFDFNHQDSPPTLSILWQSQANVQYDLQKAEDLSAWDTVSTKQGNGDEMSFEQLNLATFYRLKAYP